MPRRSARNGGPSRLTVEVALFLRGFDRMTSKGNHPGRAGHGPRSRLDDREQRLARKRRRTTTGLVEIPGPLSESRMQELREIVVSAREREKQRDAGARLTFERLDGGLAIVTSSEKLAQHIADALERSQNASVVRQFDDEGARRVLTVQLPSGGR